MGLKLAIATQPEKRSEVFVGPFEKFVRTQTVIGQWDSSVRIFGRVKGLIGKPQSPSIQPAAYNLDGARVRNFVSAIQLELNDHFSRQATMWPFCWHTFLVYQKIFVSGGLSGFVPGA
jgi:hypothetical protein